MPEHFARSPLSLQSRPIKLMEEEADLLHDPLQFARQISISMPLCSLLSSYLTVL